MAYQGPVIRSFESRYGHAVPSEFELLEALEAQQKGEELTGWNTVRLAPNKGFSSGSTTRSTFHGDASPPVTENQLLDKNYQHKPHLGQETLVKGEPKFSTANYGIPTASPYGRTERENKLLEDWKEGRMVNDRYSGIRKPQGQASRMQAQATTSNSTPQLSSMTPRQRIEYLAPLALKFDEDQKTIVNPKTGETKIARDAENRYKLLLNQEIDRVAKRYGRSNALRLVKLLESSGYGNLITREIEDTSAVDNEGKPVAGKMKSVSYEEALKLASMNPYELELSKLPKDRARLLKDLSPEFIRAVAAEQDLDDTGALSPIFRYIVRMETGVDPKESDVQRYMVENSDLIPAIKAKAKLLDSVDKRMKAYGKPSLPIRGEEEDRWAGLQQPQDDNATPSTQPAELPSRFDPLSERKPQGISDFFGKVEAVANSARPEMKSYVDGMVKLINYKARTGSIADAEKELQELDNWIQDKGTEWDLTDQRDADKRSIKEQSDTIALSMMNQVGESRRRGEPDPAREYALVGNRLSRVNELDRWGKTEEARAELDDLNKTLESERSGKESIVDMKPAITRNIDQVARESDPQTANDLRRYSQALKEAETRNDASYYKQLLLSLQKYAKSKNLAGIMAE